MTNEHRNHFNGDFSYQGLMTNLRLAFWLNLAFAILEFIGGWLTNSLSIFAGALHDLGDSATLGISWYLERFSLRKNDGRYSYGYRRFSLLGAVISAIVLIVGSIYVVMEAIPRLIHPQLSNARGMIAFSLLGIVINGVAVLRLRGAKNMNARLIMWHLLDDVLGWGAILLVSVVLIFTDARILDPILSLAITFFVLWNVIKNFRSTFSLFLQAVPEQMDIQEIENTLKQADCVRDVHHTHIWSLDGENHVLTTHVVLQEGAHREDIRKIKCLIHDFIPKYQLAHTTIEFEYRDEDCSMNQNHHQGGPNEPGRV